MSEAKGSSKRSIAASSDVNTLLAAANFAAFRTSLGMGTADTPTLGGLNLVAATSATTPFTIKGASGQTAPLMEFLDSSNNIVLEARLGVTGYNNVFYGRQAGQNIVQQTYAAGGYAGGSANTFIGDTAGSAFIYGNENTLVGSAAGLGLTGSTGSDPNLIAALNTIVGSNAGQSATTAVGSCFFGQKAGKLNTTGNYNVYIGKSVAANLSDGTGSNNVFILGAQGAAAGSNNVLIGNTAGRDQTGNYNVAIGDSAGMNVTTNENVCVGRSAGNTLSTGNQSVLVGGYAGVALTTNYGATFIGFRAGDGATGAETTIIGFQAARASTGNNGTFVGAGAGINLTSGLQNTIVGSNAGRGAASSTANKNTIVGYFAGGALATNGNGNCLFGFQAGDAITSGARNVIIGYDLDAPSPTASDQVLIANLIGGVGHASTQKLGFFATAAVSPVIQQTTGITGAAYVANAGADTATFGGYTLGQIVTALKAYGLLA